MNLLIVDDEEIEVNLIEKLTNKTGITFDNIYKAYSMKEAISILKKYMIHIIICDIEMPGGSGHELTDWIRKRSMNIEVIFSTGHAEFDYAAMALRLGVTEYLLKPVKKEKLKEALIKAMGNMPAIERQEEVDAGLIVKQAQEYIKKHYNEPLSRKELAEKYFVHPNYFSYIFKEYTSVSLREYISFVRMEKAKELLLYTNYSISDIAIQTGYSSMTYFIKQFKKELDITPKQYRKQAKQRE